MKSDSYTYQFSKPDNLLSDFIEGFWWFENPPNSQLSGIAVPSGCVDLFIYKSEKGVIDLSLIGLETHPKPIVPFSGTLIAISFRPLAVEYLLGFSIKAFLNTRTSLPHNFWGFNSETLVDFSMFIHTATKNITSLIQKQSVDERKRRLFDLIYSTDGSMAVTELARESFWSTQQINRYFQMQFGMPLKTYCNIIRFKATFRQLSQGELFPPLSFSDQSHFIKAVRKLTGVPPKELFKNENERFIQFAVLSRL